MNAEAGSELLSISNTVRQSVLEIASDVVIGLHRNDVRAIGEQQQIIRNLQVVCPRKIPAGEKPDRLQLARIRRIKDRDAVAEHVAHIKMSAVEHDLHAVRPAADIAV